MKLIPDGIITAGFDQQRPIGGPFTHNHGAEDWAGGSGIVYAPASGKARAMAFFRPTKDDSWDATEKPILMDIPCRNYWYDVYGGIVEIVADDGTYHIITHFWLSKLQVRFGKLEYVEAMKVVRNPCHAFISDPLRIQKGEKIGAIGNSGFSTGPHAHWEVHHSVSIEPHDKRIIPSQYKWK